VSEDYPEDVVSFVDVSVEVGGSASAGEVARGVRLEVGRQVDDLVLRFGVVHAGEVI